jgi:hypothetical protein
MYKVLLIVAISRILAQFFSTASCFHFR